MHVLLPLAGRHRSALRCRGVSAGCALAHRQQYGTLESPGASLNACGRRVLAHRRGGGGCLHTPHCNKEDSGQWGPVLPQYALIVPQCMQEHASQEGMIV